MHPHLLNSHNKGESYVGEKSYDIEDNFCCSGRIFYHDGMPRAGFVGGDFSTSSKTQIGNQKSQSNSSTTQGNTTNSTTTITTITQASLLTQSQATLTSTLSPKMTGHVLGPICRSRN